MYLQAFATFAKLTRLRRFCGAGSDTLMARVVVRSHEAECQGHQLLTCLQLATLAPVSIRCSWPAPRFTGDRPWTAGMMKLHLRLSEHCATTCGTKHVINLRGTRLGVTPSMTRCNDDLQAHGKILTLPHVLCERHVFVFTRVCVCACNPVSKGSIKTRGMIQRPC